MVDRPAHDSRGSLVFSWPSCRWLRSAAACLALAGSLAAVGLAHASPPDAPATPSPENPPLGERGYPERPAPAPGPITIRIATFNIEDVRTTDLLRDDHPRLKRLAEVLQRLRPNIVLINELAYDMPAAPGFDAAAGEGKNAQRFIEKYLAVAQAPDVQPLPMVAFVRPSNTGVPSGFDLDNDGEAVLGFPAPPEADADGVPGPQTPGGRRYGNDCWGFGTFPGQYAMALLVDPRLEILADRAREFRRFAWSSMDAALKPTSPDGTPWYNADEWPMMRLSSKSHWDVPVRLPNGTVIHLLCSHPTPPGFDGAERRNKKRNHDEIRFWIDYVNNEPFIVDDAGVEGGLADGSPYVILGDLNADPDEGNSLNDPIGLLLRFTRRIGPDPRPASDLPVAGLDADDTAMFRLRVDYVLPSRELTVRQSGVWRRVPTGGQTPNPSSNPTSNQASNQPADAKFPSDHFPVWIDATVPATASQPPINPAPTSPAPTSPAPTSPAPTSPAPTSPAPTNPAATGGRP